MNRSTAALDLSSGVSSVSVEASASAERISAVTYRLAGKEYPLIEEPQCHTCKAPKYRRTIEELFIIGYTPAFIHKQLDGDHGLSYQSILGHLRKHLPIEFLLEAKERERRALEMNVDPEDGTFFTEVHLLNEIQRRVYEMIVRGELKPTIGQAIEIARLKAMAGQADVAVSSDVYQEAFAIFMETASKHMSEEEYDLFLAELYENQTLRRLDEKMKEERAARQRALAGG